MDFKKEYKISKEERGSLNKATKQEGITGW